MSEPLIQQIISKLEADKSSDSRASYNCRRCFDVGMCLRNQGDVTVAEHCLCLRRKIAKAQLAQIPPVFGKPKLSRLRPRIDLHPKQDSIVEFVRYHPNDSYLFTGRNGIGKSHIAWTIYRHALAKRRPAIALTVRDLLSDFRRWEMEAAPEGWTPRITADQLRKPGKPWLIFLDEFEKARPSEFASEQLFHLLDAAKSFNHQLVVTSNMRAAELRTHWSRIDEVYGNSIMTRLNECNLMEMF